jgi:hypothetical protein
MTLKFKGSTLHQDLNKEPSQLCRYRIIALLLTVAESSVLKDLQQREGAHPSFWKH